MLQYAATRENLEDLVLSEVSQSKKDKYRKSPLTGSTVVKITKTESITVVAGGRGEGGNGQLLFNRYRVSVLKGKKSPGDGWR